MRTDGEDEGRLAKAHEALVADSIVYKAVNWGIWRSRTPQPPAAPIAALAAPASAPGGTAPAATETPAIKFIALDRAFPSDSYQAAEAAAAESQPRARDRPGLETSWHRVRYRDTVTD